jgi:hypothetical protein
MAPLRGLKGAFTPEPFGPGRNRESVHQRPGAPWGGSTMDNPNFLPDDAEAGTSQVLANGGQGYYAGFHAARPGDPRTYRGGQLRKPSVLSSPIRTAACC